MLWLADKNLDWINVDTLGDEKYWHLELVVVVKLNTVVDVFVI